MGVVKKGTLLTYTANNKKYSNDPDQDTAGRKNNKGVKGVIKNWIVTDVTVLPGSGGYPDRNTAITIQEVSSSGLTRYFRTVSNISPRGMISFKINNSEEENPDEDFAKLMVKRFPCGTKVIYDNKYYVTVAKNNAEKDMSDMTVNITVKIDGLLENEGTKETGGRSCFNSLSDKDFAKLMVKIFPYGTKVIYDNKYHTTIAKNNAEKDMTVNITVNIDDRLRRLVPLTRRRLGWKPSHDIP